MNSQLGEDFDIYKIGEYLIESDKIQETNNTFLMEKHDQVSEDMGIKEVAIRAVNFV